MFVIYLFLFLRSNYSLYLIKKIIININHFCSGVSIHMAITRMMDMYVLRMN